MSRKKSILALILSCIMMFTATACGSTAAPAASAAASGSAAAGDVQTDANGCKVGQTVLKCGFNQSIDNPEAQTLINLSNALYDATEGRYSMEIYPNEQLGAQKETLELVESGAIEMSLVANTIVEGVDPDFAILGTPYIYDSIDHQEKVFLSGKLDDLFASTESSGFNVLCAYSLGSRSVYTKDGPITCPEDLKGLKIRVMQSDTMVQMINYMGGVGTPMAQGDVYSAIQSGTLDGAENNIITYTDLLQYEVAPYYSYTNHLMVPDELCINSAVLQSMSDEDRAAFQKLATESISSCFDLCAELRDSYQKTCEDKGVIFTDVDITPFQENMAPFIQEVANRSDMTKAVYDVIMSER